MQQSSFPEAYETLYGRSLTFDNWLRTLIGSLLALIAGGLEKYIHDVYLPTVSAGIVAKFLESRKGGRRKRLRMDPIIMQRALEQTQLLGGSRHLVVRAITGHTNASCLLRYTELLLQQERTRQILRGGTRFSFTWDAGA